LGAPLAEKVETEVGKPEKTVRVQLIIKYIYINPHGIAGMGGGGVEMMTGGVHSIITSCSK